MRATFAGDVQAPGSARRWAVSALEEVTRGSSGPRLDDVVLVVSELVTNADRHSNGPYILEL